MARSAGGFDSGKIGGRKIDRLGEREIDRERERSKWMEDSGGQIGGFGGGVEWAGDRWRPNRQSVVAVRSASALESLVKHSLRSVVKIGAQLVLVGAWLAIGEVGLGCLLMGVVGGVD